jgi:hypothetical protein
LDASADSVSDCCARTGAHNASDIAVAAAIRFFIKLLLNKNPTKNRASGHVIKNFRYEISRNTRNNHHHIKRNGQVSEDTNVLTLKELVDECDPAAPTPQA